MQWKRTIERNVAYTIDRWSDPSGERLRDWMGVSREMFYDERSIAVVPIAFCYPGSRKGVAELL